MDKDRIKAVYEEGLRSEAVRFLCAEVKGEVVGFCSFCRMLSFWKEGYIGYIPELIVDEHHRGRGIGRALLASMAEAAKETGCKLIELDSGFHRERAHRFYESIGFTKRAYMFSKEL